ncbi:MAG: glycosyltransferase [archaeon]|nr:glycosyltransferase [archaeon]
MIIWANQPEPKDFNQKTVESGLVSVIIPTIRTHIITLSSLIGLDGIEIIIVRDRWRNVSKARNLGALKAKGEILVFIDDDASFDPNYLFEHVAKVSDGKVLWLESPLFLFIRRNDFLRAGGFDERIRPIMAETVEFRYNLKKLGFSIIDIDSNGVIHFGGKFSKYKRFLNQWNLTYIHMKYEKNPKKLLRIFFAKNPLRTIRQIIAFYYWQIISKILPRSSLIKQ